MIISKKTKVNHLVSVIVPAYKQEQTIQANLKRVKSTLDELRYPTEIIVVVDGKKIDKTFERASTFTKNHSNNKVVGYDKNKGKGYAVRYGMAVSKGDIIAFMDAGEDLNTNGLSMLLEHFDWYDADIIVASKRHPASKVTYPWQRKIFSFGYQMLVRLLFGLKIKDTQVGMKFYRREVLEKVLPRLLVKQFAFDIEILSVANYLGYKNIYEAPVEINLAFGGSSGLTNRKVLMTIIRMFWDTLAVFYRLRIVRYYDDKNKRLWKYDPELNFRVNVG